MVAQLEAPRKRVLVSPYAGEAAIYARQSRIDDSRKKKEDKKQAIETTLDTQTKAGLKEAYRLGYNVSDDAVFTERYTGAELWDRPVLSELRRRIRAGYYQALIVYSTDRLAREPIHLGLIAEECSRADCELIFVTEPLDDSPEGQLILFIKGYAAKIEREKLKERVMRGRKAIIDAGKLPCSGVPLYGYKWNTKLRVREIDLESSAVVLRIFQWTIEGISAQSISKRLNQLRVPPPAVHSGRQFKDGRTPAWSNTAVSKILKDDSYTGITYVNKFRVTDTRNKKSGRMYTEERPREEWQTIPDPSPDFKITPQIITPATFQAARKMVERNMRKAANARNVARPVLLRELIFCAECERAGRRHADGSPMPLYPMSETAYMKPNVAVYKCAHSRTKAAKLLPASEVCRAPRVKAAEVESRVWEKVLSYFQNPDLIAAEVERVVSEMPNDNLRQDLASAERQLEKTERLRDKLYTKWKEALADDDDIADRFESDYKAAASDVKALKAVIADLGQRLSAYESAGETAKAFQEQIAKASEGFRGEFSFEEKRAALTALNVRVFAHVSDKETHIYIRLNTGVVLQTVAGSQHKYRDIVIEIPA